jgi:hypothetical protein
MIEAPARVRALPYLHLARLTDEHGIFEHARHADPRPEHGYCLDDVARALIVVVREPDRTPELDRLTEVYLSFVEHAVVADGRAHNRRDLAGSWSDDLAVSDWWGRGVMAAGFTAAHAQQPAIRARALRVFRRAAQRRPVDVRAAAFAALGAAEVLTGAGSPDARRLLVDIVPLLPREAVGGWGWIEPRLRYANATLAEALLASGSALGEPGIVADGLRALEALVELETRDGHLSIAGHSGRGPEDTDPLFDQQPIETAALADAALIAWKLTADPRWVDVVRLAWGWFEGGNDGGMPMMDPLTGAGYDGLERNGRNDNRGAESTIAALTTLQRMREIGDAQ